MGKICCESLPISLQTCKNDESFQINHNKKISAIHKMRDIHRFWLIKVEGFFRQENKQRGGQGGKGKFCFIRLSK